MSAVYQMVLLLVFLYYLKDYSSFRKKSALQKGWFIGLNLVTLFLILLLLFGFRPSMPTRFMNDLVSPWIAKWVEEVIPI